MTEIVIHLPWPAKELSPNARVHWSKKAKAAKAYKHTCWSLAKEAKAKVDWDGQVHLWVSFIPPDRRLRDDDNLVAAFKSGRDGLALALGIDDSRFALHSLLHTDRMRFGGGVEVRISQSPAWDIA